MPVRFASHQLQPENLLPHLTRRFFLSARTEVVLILAGMLLHGCQERVS